MGLEEAKGAGRKGNSSAQVSEQRTSTPGPVEQQLNTSTGDGIRERVVTMAGLWQREAEVLQAALRNSHRHASATHPCVQELSSTVRWAAEQLGMNPDSVSVHVFKPYPVAELKYVDGSENLHAYMPQAFVISWTGAIFVNVALLEGLSWSTALINAVLYHEVAHLQLKRSALDAAELAGRDPLQSRLESYEVEYHCDRLAALLSSKRGEDPRNIGRALQALHDAERTIIESSDLNLNGRRLEGEVDLSYLSTHPATARRIRANMLVAQNLPAALQSANTECQKVLDSELPVCRPLGRVVDQANSLGFNRDACKIGLFDPPIEVAELLEGAGKKEGAARVETISDWFASLSGFLQSEDGAEFEREFSGELRGKGGRKSIGKEEIGQILESINLARIIDNDVVCQLEQAGMWDLPSLPKAVDLLVERYVEMGRMQQPLHGVLADLVTIGDRGDRRFGTGAVFCGEKIARLCIDVEKQGGTAEIDRLVEILDGCPNLLRRLYMLPELKEMEHPLRLLVSEKCKTPFGPFREGQLEASLMGCTLERWCGPALSSRDCCQLPVCVRREPGERFRVERQVLRDGREYELVVVGDNPLGAQEEGELQKHLQMAVDRGVETLASLHNRPVRDYVESKLWYYKRSAEVVTSVREAVIALQSLAPKSAEEKRQYLRGEFVRHFEADLSNRTRLAWHGATSTSVDDIIDVRVSNEFELRVQLEGERGVREDLIRRGRSSFAQARYAGIEERSSLHVQHERLWRELDGEQYNSMQVGLSKAQFLANTYPVKTLHRDQLICESLGLPPLDYLDDLKALSTSVDTESSLETLLFLRDEMRSPALSQIVEARLFRLFEAEPGAFLDQPAIKAARMRVFQPLPELLQGYVASEERLLGVLSCFARASRERDRHLVEFRDRAEGRALKEALGSLFSDPNLASTSGAVAFQSQQDVDAMFSGLRLISPYDKAQALLYLMGQRSFRSPLEMWFLGQGGPYGTEITELVPGKAWTRYEMPDVLVRTQKTLGIAVATAENLQAGLLNERTLTDFLSEAIYGQNGIADQPAISERFFKLAGRVLVRGNLQLVELPKAQLQQLEQFVAFAFEKCPPNRLPSVILKVWEASKRDSKDMPTLAATILGKLGPAFVKFGQRLSTLDIDDEYKRAFRKLCSENAQVDTSFVYHNLGVICPPGTFDEARTGRKIAEGSMAATFEGTLERSGEQVAIKVIHPHIKGDIDEDVEYIRNIVDYLNEERTFSRLLVPRNTPEIIRQQLSTQADSALEMEKADLLRAALKPRTDAARFVVPEVKREDSGDGAIVFSFMPSHELDSPEIARQGADAQAIRNAVGLEVLRMLLEERCFQSDVNLGNFGVLKDARNGAIVRSADSLPTVVWYDPGAVEEIGEGDQKLLLQLMKAAASGKAEEIPALVSKMVQGGEDRQEQVREICIAFGNKLESGAAIDLAHLQDRFNDFFDALSGAGCLVQDKWLVIANTLSMAAPLLEGASEARVKDLVVGAMWKHGVLSAREKAFLGFASFWK